MIEGDEACKVLVYANDLRELKRSGISLKAQVGDEFKKIPGVFLKKYHFTNSAGYKAPLVYLIEDETISADEFLWYKVPGLSCDNSVRYGFVAFSRNRSGSEKYFEHFIYIYEIFFPFITARQAPVEACTGKVC